MAVLHPVKLRITNYPEGQSETFEVENNPDRPRRRHARDHLLPRAAGSRRTTSWPSRSPSISASTRRPRVPPEGRLPRQVHRLREGRGRQRDGDPGEYDPDSRGGNPADGRKVQGRHDPLGRCPRAPTPRCACTTTCSPTPTPTAADKDFLDCLNPGLPETCSPAARSRRMRWPRREAGQDRAASSSCAWATSALDNKDSRRSIWCSTAPSALKDSFRSEQNAMKKIPTALTGRNFLRFRRAASYRRSARGCRARQRRRWPRRGRGNG